MCRYKGPTYVVGKTEIEDKDRYITCDICL